MLAGCGYSFVLQGGGNLKSVALEQSLNATQLLEAGLSMDAELERALAMQGLLKRNDQAAPRLRCTITSTSARQISSDNTGENERFRLTVSVKAELLEAGGKSLWQGGFAGDGDYAQGGQEEDALEAACRSVAEQLARQLSTLNI